MNKSRGSLTKSNLPIWGAAIIILISRLPFLHLGYGTDPDAWRVIGAARQIASTGNYVASRFPGYPLQECAYALVPRSGPIVMNGMTAIFSVIAFILFSLTLRRLGSKDYLWWGLAFAFTPVIFINSINAMDYMWALSAILASFYFSVCRNSWVAGLFLGIAIGCRMTSGAMLVPLGLLWFHNDYRKYATRQFLQFALTACGVGAFMFLPVFLTYGFSFFTYYGSGYPSTPIIGMMTYGVWGKLGFASLLLALVVGIIRKIRKRVFDFPTLMPNRYLLSWVVAIVIYVLAFLWLPLQSGYLIPIVPFVLLVAARYLSRSWCFVVLLSLVYSSSGDRVWSDYERRLYRMEVVNRAITEPATKGEKIVMVSADWLPQLQITRQDQQLQSKVEYVYFLNQEQLHQYQQQQYKIYYLPRSNHFNLKFGRVDLDEAGALPWF